jgi:hypothetical protein
LQIRDLLIGSTNFCQKELAENPLDMRRNIINRTSRRSWMDNGCLI